MHKIETYKDWNTVNRTDGLNLVSFYNDSVQIEFDRTFFFAMLIFDYSTSKMTGDYEPPINVNYFQSILYGNFTTKNDTSDLNNTFYVSLSPIGQKE